MARYENVALDSSHLATAKSDIVKTAEKLGSKIKHLHLSDSDFRPRKNRPNSIEDCHMIPGRGKLPLKKYLHTLAEIGYNGFIVLELLPEPVDAGLNDKIVLHNLREALKFVEENFTNQ